MELFSEIYGCYYQIIDRILTEAEAHPITRKEMEQICKAHGFLESGFYLLPRLTDGEWNLLDKEDEGFRARTGTHRAMPFTRLQRSWLKTLLQDSRFCLFFTEEEISALRQFTEDAELLWRTEDFHYFDRYADGDPYDSPSYQKHFRTLLAAVTGHQYAAISYHSEKGNRITHQYLPLKLEYSEKNDRFRLLALQKRKTHTSWICTLNVRGITDVSLLPDCFEKEVSFESLIQRSYYHEPVRLLIKNQRNALERTMLHFSNYKKKTKKIDEDTWECLIYYNSSMETELLIEILSFGPAVRVTGPPSFLRQIQARLKRQMELFSDHTTASPS